MKSVAAGLVSILALALVLPPADAEAQLAFNCTYTVSPLIDFGGTALPTPQIDVMPVVVSVTCSSLLNLLNGLRVCLSMPAGSGGVSTADRRMVLDGQFIGYQLYRDPSRTQVWGTFADAVPLTFTFSALNVPITQNVQAYARLVGGQSDKGAGVYQSVLAPVARRQSYLVLGTPPACQTVTANVETLAGVTSRFEVESDCSVTAVPLDFGTVSGLGAGHLAATNLAVRCTLNGAYSIALDGGSVGNDINARRMEHVAGSDTIAYQLYQDAGRTQLWGNTAGTIVNRTGTGAAESIPIYGLVPSQGAKPAGRYEDEITVTVTF